MHLFCKVMFFVQKRKNTVILDLQAFPFSYFRMIFVRKSQNGH